MVRSLRAAFTILLILLASVFPARAQNALFEQLRAADLRVASIGWRLARANAALCDGVQAGTGLVLHTLDQFDSGQRGSASSYFGFTGPTSIEAVVPGSPADRSGLRADDALVRVGPIDVQGIKGAAGTTQRLVATEEAIAQLPSNVPIAVEVLRRGTPIRATLQPEPVCRSRFELRIGPDYNATSDGAMVQIGSRFLDSYPDDQVAAVMAHEFSHNILHHRERLEARGVHFGMLSGFGANVKYFRQTELQADILSLYLLANAGYPPEAAVTFWHDFGPRHAGGILRSRSHPAWRDRIATLEAEIPRVKASTVRPLVPGLIAGRDEPLDGNWQALLRRD